MSQSIDLLGRQTPVWEVVAGGAAVLGGLVVVVVLARLLRRWKASLGVKLAAVFALMATAVSMNTNWRFFGTQLQITNVYERAGLFAVVEGAMLTFAVQARENKLADEGKGKAGAQGTLLWVMSGLAMIPAWIEAGAVAGTVRALIGPFLAALLWHYALGLELQRVKPTVAKDGLVAALVARAREFLLATLGAAQPDQSALEIRQDRALNKAARLADRLDTMEHNWFGHRTRVRNALRKAVRLSGAGTNPARRRELVELMHTTRTADQISHVTMASPWQLAAAQIEAEHTAATVALEPAPALAELEPAPSQDGEAAPRIDKSTFGALVGALAEAVSAQIAAPSQSSAYNGAAGTQDGHTSAQQGAPSTALNESEAEFGPSIEVEVPWFLKRVESDTWQEAVRKSDAAHLLRYLTHAVVFPDLLEIRDASGIDARRLEEALELLGGPERAWRLAGHTITPALPEVPQDEQEEDEETDDEDPPGRPDRAGRTALWAGLDVLVMAGDLRVFTDTTRNEAAYEVNAGLPGGPISKGTVRRYAADYVKAMALYERLDALVALGDLRVFNDATRDQVVDEVNATLPGGPFPVRAVRRYAAEYVASRRSQFGADLGASVADEAAPEPSPGGEFVTLPRQITPDGDPVAVDGWGSAH